MSYGSLEAERLNLLAIGAGRGLLAAPSAAVHCSVVADRRDTLTRPEQRDSCVQPCRSASKA